MVLVRKPKTAGFRPKSMYDIFIDQQLTLCFPDGLPTAISTGDGCFSFDTLRDRVRYVRTLKSA